MPFSIRIVVFRVSIINFNHVRRNISPNYNICFVFEAYCRLFSVNISLDKDLPLSNNTIGSSGDISFDYN